jgi:heme/copper-type cytochrome/quinol oxidase subunit 3
MTMLSAPSTPSQVYPRRTPPLPNATLGMLIFVVTEVMFFAGLVSAHTIAKSNLPFDWPPPGQPRLPVASTAFNTLALLASGWLVGIAGARFRKDPRKAEAPLLFGLLLGAIFVIFQGTEWVALIREGLTLTSSPHGSFFYLIVGAHALHAVCALGLLIMALVRLSRRQLEAATFSAVRVFWFFVVAVWPVLYWKVYL